ncbi:roadblock/LC7 domain-containing protein [Actinoplanes oblitus]|uniref:Roadblock/LC7 domain-containing protein n=1 Tax=Actinoplanes oblitus TaxID=3040509 RepID=A0ABY8WR38_9ACTN|nr:roadblock/LC7 domain-containing protein [Actinoplanes oblitus]WIN00357.1 roadblock/LC7 domain-containing protein [Actinoplanes oblitus]
MTTPPTMQDLSWLLDDFAEGTTGVAHVVVVSADGLLLAASKDLPGGPAGQLSAIVSGVVSLTGGAAALITGGVVKQTIVQMESGYLFLMSISNGSSMTVLASGECDLGQVGYEMALLVERIGEYLSPVPRQTSAPVSA